MKIGSWPNIHDRTHSPQRVKPPRRDRQALAYANEDSDPCNFSSIALIASADERRSYPGDPVLSLAVVTVRRNEEPSVANRNDWEGL
jgi:hypothetical protein